MFSQFKGHINGQKGEKFKQAPRAVLLEGLSKPTTTGDNNAVLGVCKLGNMVLNKGSD
jgi:hypothetical protein